ncbi:MAG TPA: ComF family protein [Gammaproteobacteria bacterium]|nr:ComF family protein [Gammaproteobacteria bacterium]
MVYNYRLALRNLLFPGHCRLCGNATRGGPDLCQSCHRDLPWLGSVCSRCAHPLYASDADVRCGHCQKHPPAFDRTTALFHYCPPVDHLIKCFKFAEELQVGSLLSGLLAAKLAERRNDLPGLLLPVPLHPARLRSRGFNQATEIARHVGRTLGIKLDYRLCRRKRNTEAQSLLSPTARRLNLRNAFAVRHPLQASHVAIIDDVMTTGHTSNELARVLKRAGAVQVEVWVIARAGGGPGGTGYR